MAHIELITFVNDGWDDEGFENDGKTYVSHGIHSETLELIVLPQETLTRIGAKWDDIKGYHLPITEKE
jgi:hypothetical protein